LEDEKEDQTLLENAARSTSSASHTESTLAGGSVGDGSPEPSSSPISPYVRPRNSIQERYASCGEQEAVRPPRKVQPSAIECFSLQPTLDKSFI
ncbi:hypothetical protein CEXT_280251, partial [Caerostris extrusa]